MSKGKCKFYNGKWHLTIRDLLTGKIFSYIIPCQIATKALTSGSAEDMIAPYESENLTVLYTRGYPNGIRWQIKKQHGSNWEDYTPARKPKLKKSAELVSFAK